MTKCVVNKSHSSFIYALMTLHLSANLPDVSSDGFSVRSAAAAAAEHGGLLSARSAPLLQPSTAAACSSQPAAVHAAPPTATAGETETTGRSAEPRQLLE